MPKNKKPNKRNTLPTVKGTIKRVTLTTDRDINVDIDREKVESLLVNAFENYTTSNKLPFNKEKFVLKLKLETVTKLVALLKAGVEGKLITTDQLEQASLPSSYLTLN